MLSIWIIHRQPKARAAIARISGVGERAVLASPTDAVLDGADAPTVVVLGLSGDFEVELDFVHRHASKLGGCEWILLAAAEDVDEAQRLFDTLPGRFLVYPPEARVLRRALRAAVQHRDADPLSARQGRAELQARFARWFGDLELPELMRALDPRLARVPVLIHGEEGTGRGLLARYVHACGGHPEHALVQISCAADTRASDLLQQMSVGSTSRDGALTFYLEDVDRLPISVQRRLRDWIEFGLPDGSAHRHGHRFMASVAGAHDLDADPGLDPRLAETLSGLTIVLPPLRERGSHVAPFVVDTAASLARARGERARRFSAEALARLAAHPWPGNLHELEAVVTRTLAFTQADPIEPIHLRFPADLEWLGEPDGRNELEPEGLGEMPSGIHGDDIERPTAFPTPLVVPVAPAPEPL
ncbi:MAG: sigma 54-interacting transcriptional regulator, partial [Actinomycetota bacterium]|nr:sigma 54-interacting transcriptional regulator [Actinomycetota bacterium]